MGVNTEGREILHYFEPGLFFTDLRATTKDGVLKELTDRIARGHGVRDPELLLEMLKRRESLGSTGIGKGVAIPHGRSLAISELRVLFGLSKRGVNFDAIDDEPVHIFFLIVAPPQDKHNEYLPLLGKIAELVKDKKVRDRLIEIQEFDELRGLLEEKFS